MEDWRPMFQLGFLKLTRASGEAFHPVIWLCRPSVAAQLHPLRSGGGRLEEDCPASQRGGARDEVIRPSVVLWDSACLQQTLYVSACLVCRKTGCQTDGVGMVSHEFAMMERWCLSFGWWLLLARDNIALQGTPKPCLAKRRFAGCALACYASPSSLKGYNRKPIDLDRSLGEVCSQDHYLR